MLNAQEVIGFHETALLTEGGLRGWRGPGALESALSRVTFQIQFTGMKNVFERLPRCMR